MKRKRNKRTIGQVFNYITWSTNNVSYVLKPLVALGAIPKTVINVTNNIMVGTVAANLASEIIDQNKVSKTNA